MTPASTTLVVALVLATVAAAGACVPPDCDNVDYGTCGNACCNISVSVDMGTLAAKNVLMSTLMNGGPDGRYKLSMTAEGTLGFADFRGYNLGFDFLGQAIHHTKVHHYNDTVNLGIAPNGSNKSTILAFSLSGIAGAYGDGGQNFKNLIQIFKGMGKQFTYDIVKGCPAPSAPAATQEQAEPAVEAPAKVEMPEATPPMPENLHASCRLTWTFPSSSCTAASGALAGAVNAMGGFSDCDSSEKCGYTLISANATELIAYHRTPVHKYRDDISISFSANGSGCTARGYSTSTIWYAVLDDGTNYCNLHNLAEKTGLTFNEDIDTSDCTQYQTANCNKY